MPEAATPRRLKVGVLTFHRCINYGSYWQARALVEGLRARGHDAELLDHDCPRVRYAELRCAFQPLLPRRSPRSDFPEYAAKARRVLAAADALCSFETHQLLRADQGLSRAATTATLITALTALVQGDKT